MRPNWGRNMVRLILGGVQRLSAKRDWIMKKLLLSGVTLAALAMGPALAADLPRKAPPAPPPPPVISWTGWYVGLNAGAVWGCGNAHNTLSPLSSDVNFPHGIGHPPPTSPNPEPAAHLAAISSVGTFDFDNGCRNANFIGGGQIGYQWQFGTWVAGIEADIQGIGGNNNSGTFVKTAHLAFDGGQNWVGTATFERDNSWLGTLRGRIGFLWTPAFLVYATGGLAYGKTSGDITLDIRNDAFCCTHIPPADAFFSGDKTRAGWTVGGGVEWMFAPRWSVKAEYLYYDLGSRDFSFPVTITDTNSNRSATFVSNGSFDIKGNIARVGINYHFGGAY